MYVNCLKIPLNNCKLLYKFYKFLYIFKKLVEYIYDNQCLSDSNY